MQSYEVLNIANQRANIPDELLGPQAPVSPGVCTFNFFGVGRYRKIRTHG